MAIQREFVLRYQKDGHVRFQVPAQICNEAVAKTVTDKISELEGVYRVHLYRSQQKLAIRYQESICDFRSVAKQLYSLLAELEKKGALKPVQESRRKLSGFRKSKSSQKNKETTGWVKKKYGEVKETLQAAKVIAKLGLKKPQALVKDPEKAVIDFLNDILVLFLIKLHWQEITQKWILNPLRYRYEWMALFYMFYLLMRSRRAK